MAKKMLSMFSLITFLVLNFSCYSWGDKNIETITRWRGKKKARIKVQAINKKSGKKIEFRADSPGRIVEGGIQGESNAPRQREIVSQSDVSRIFRTKNRSIYKIILKSGQIIEPIYAVEDNDQIIIYNSETIFVPFNEIQSVRISSVDIPSTLLLVLGILTGLIRSLDAQ